MFLDTCEFSIPVREGNIKDWSRFRRAGQGSYLLSPYEIEKEKQKPFTKLTLNPTVSTRQKGIHLPLVNLIGRNGCWSVHPDGSVPRFFFGTNLFELDKVDLDPVVEKYFDFLHDNGFLVNKEEIYKAEIIKVDISKVLLVRPDIPPHSLLEVFRKIDFDVRHEIHDKDYYSSEYRDVREGGKGFDITWGTKKRKIASFYLKYAQIVSQGIPTLVERGITQFVSENDGRIYQAWKLEECLFDKTRVRYVLNKVSGQEKKYYTLTDIWDRELVKKVLLERGTKLFSGADLNTLLLGSLSAREIGDCLKKVNPNIQMTRIANISHWARFAREEGQKEMKKWLKKEYSRSTQARILREIRGVTEGMRNLPMQDVSDDFFRQLNELKPIRSIDDLLIKSGPTKITETVDRGGGKKDNESFALLPLFQELSKNPTSQTST